MATKHLSRMPHNISDQVWWYETPYGFEIFIQARDPVSKLLIWSNISDIPWKTIRAALARKDRK